MSRSTSGSPSWLACERSRSRVSGVTGSESGTSPMCWTRSRWRRCSSRSLTSRARSWPWSASSSTNASRPAVSLSTIRSQSRKSASSSTAPSSWRTACTVTSPSVAAASWSSVETASRKLPRALRAIEREGGVGRLDLLAVGDLAEQLRELGQPRAGEEEGLAARAHGPEHLVELGRAEDEDEVRRRLLDQLQERVPRGVGELVRLVEDVDLEAALDRLEDDVLADLADVVDPALARGVHLDHVERRAACDRDARVAGLVRGRRRALLAVERLGEDACERGLPGAARAGEEVGLAHLVVLDRVAEGPDYGLLADDLVEVLRPVLPVERGHLGHRIEEGAREPGVPKRGGSPRGNQGFPRDICPVAHLPLLRLSRRCRRRSL